MDIRAGLIIDEPPVTVRWDVSEQDLQSLIGTDLRHVTTGYWATRVAVFGGLRCSLGFHFMPKSGVLREVEFFRDTPMDQKSSFDEFQRYFEGTFGPPKETRRGTAGFPSYRWRFGSVEIIHLIFDRFGPEEHMRIRHVGLFRRIRRGRRGSITMSWS